MKRWPTLKTIEKAADEYAGWCIACGRKAYGIEPDAHEYECEHCGQNKVYGAEEMALMGMVR